jgi:hypothetical protein
VVRNCVTDMPEDVKRKVVDHTHIAITSPDEELFVFASDEAHNNLFCKSVTYGSGKQGKLKPGHPCKWMGEKGLGEFSW